MTLIESDGNEAAGIYPHIRFFRRQYRVVREVNVLITLIQCHVLLFVVVLLVLRRYATM